MESNSGEGSPATVFLLCSLFLFTPIFPEFASSSYTLLASTGWRLFCVQKVFVGKGKEYYH